MLEYSRIDISEGIDVNKNVCQKNVWYFKDISFKYEKYLSNGCHVLMEKGMSF